MGIFIFNKRVAGWDFIGVLNQGIRWRLSVLSDANLLIDYCGLSIEGRRERPEAPINGRFNNRTAALARAVG